MRRASSQMPAVAIPKGRGWPQLVSWPAHCNATSKRCLAVLIVAIARRFFGCQSHRGPPRFYPVFLFKRSRIEFGGEEDNLHLLVSLPPASALADFANALKTSTSRLLRRDFPILKRRGSALWLPSHFVCSCAGASLKTVKKYVQRQSARTELPAHRAPPPIQRLLLVSLMSAQPA